MVHLVFGDEQAHRVHLHDDVDQGIADGGCQRQFARRPGRSRPSHDLGPGGKRTSG